MKQIENCQFNFRCRYCKNNGEVNGRRIIKKENEFVEIIYVAKCPNCGEIIGKICYYVNGAATKFRSKIEAKCAYIEAFGNEKGER